MAFQPGESGNPAGRPRGSCSGRTMALRALDDMLAEDENIEMLKAAFVAELHKNPIRFFMDIIMPLLPRNAVLDLGSAGPIQWVSLLDAFPLRDRPTGQVPRDGGLDQRN